MADAESVIINTEDYIGETEYHTPNRKVTTPEWFILVANFILELPSAVFDQLSSVHKPQYALLSMLMSFIVLILSIVDLVYKGRKKRVTFMWRGLIPWFYYQHPNRTLMSFGTFSEIIGLVCSIFQCVFTSIGYGFLYRHVDNPINVNAWPVIFAFGVLYYRGPERLPILRNRESTLLLRTLNEEENTAVFPLSSSTVLKINKGDITKWFVDGYSDAIVNSANQRMLGGGGADGAIHSAAGPELFDACYKVPEVQPGVRCPTGEARITPGFRLLASHVIHTVGPIYGFDVDPAASLKSAYRNSLKLARDNNIKYIAFPAISCGIYGYPHEEAAAISISTIKEFKDDLKEVHFVLFFDEIYDVWLKKAKELLLPWPDSQER
ncbi:hypothetical protein JCGZ_03328 [Jatropha curcas]|uniref:Macro domain-containing protein n=1 Tax=Jatropha curcas TaxID=180498 RepID=A0A067JCX9_JATCU|nr:ADP-ribose glycohydrolase MACROD2 isoform X1 [Jatropha curcas]XP_037496570.1 ADP-ribose glycohydrolase MACROD2 isoform X1 [Jatropha curcas]XP_037496571.1 ADP-ribose glycohydrolase MACROD2 isoform X2 [Jatropha curcas]KDP21657.1 hypothetical protein JCGZ_03328 [Jatropha curcas]